MMVPVSSIRLAAAILLVPLIAALALAVFAWPTANLATRDLPLGLVGPAPVSARLAAQLQTQHPGAFALHTYSDAAQARAAIRDRSIYGAIVASRSGTTLLVASAGSFLVAQLLTQVLTPAAGGHSGPGLPRHLVDVVPAAAKDPRGLALGASVLPLVLAGVITALLLTLVSRPGLLQAAALGAAAGLAGLTADAITQGWLGLLEGNWLANAGAFALTILAVACAPAGLSALLGRPGFGLGALLMVFIGNPFSAVTTAPELLPKPVGMIGQLLPPGAGGNLLRSTAFFGGGGAGDHLAVLGVWALLGLAGVALGGLHRRRVITHPSHGTSVQATAAA